MLIKLVLCAGISAVIIRMISEGWKEAWSDWAEEQAEIESERRFQEKIKSTEYRIHLKAAIIDDMERSGQN